MTNQQFLITTSAAAAFLFSGAFNLLLPQVKTGQSFPPSLVSSSSESALALARTNEWEVYRNEEKKLEFRYPPSLQLSQKGEGIYLENQVGGALLYLKVLDNPEGLTLKQWWDSQCPCKTQPLLQDYQLTETIINGLTTLKLTKKKTDNYQDFKVIVASPERIYHFNFSPTQKDVGLAEQIFGTFRILP